MAQRQNTPLFELLEEERQEARAASGVERQPPPPKPKPSPTRDRPARAATPAATRFAGEFRAPKVWVYGAAAGAVVLVIVVWSLGVLYGESRAESRYADTLSASQPTPVEPRPIERPSSGSATRVSDQGSERSADRRAGEPAAGGARDGGGATGGVYLTSLGPVPTDPREVGSNYLKLASGVGVGQAEAVIAFLAGRQVQAVAVPSEVGGGVDRAGRAANNRDSLDLYSLYGVPSSRFSASTAERRRHADRLQRLGREWLGRPEGQINFDRPQWTKHDG